MKSETKLKEPLSETKNNSTFVEGWEDNFRKKNLSTSGRCSATGLKGHSCELCAGIEEESPLPDQRDAAQDAATLHIP